MPPIYVGVSGEWKDLLSINLGIGGAFKAVTGGHIGVGGAWKRIFPRAIPRNMIALFASAPDSPWDALSYTDIFPLGAEAEGDEDLYSHTHTHDTVTNVFGNGTTYAADTAATVQTVLGVHSTGHNYDHSHSATDHQPPWQSWRAAAANGAPSIPTTAKLFYSGSSIPDGWARATYTADSYVKLDSSGAGATGGSATHTHSHPNATATSMAVNRQKWVLAGKEHHAANASHTHTVPDHDATNNEPPYVILDMVSPTSEAFVIPSGIVAFFIGSFVPIGWSVYSTALGRFIKLNNVGVEGTGGSAGHGHTFSKTSGTYYGTVRKAGADGSTASYINHSHPVSGDHAAVDNNSMPLARGLLICKKD